MVFAGMLGSSFKIVSGGSTPPTGSQYWRITFENHTSGAGFYCVGDIELYDGSTLLSENSTSNTMANTSVSPSDPALTNMTRKISLSGFDLYGESNTHGYGNLRVLIDTIYTNQPQSYFYQPHSPHRIVFAFNQNQNVTEIMVRNILDTNPNIHSDITKVERWDGTQYVTMGQSGTNAGASGGSTTYSISAPSSAPTTYKYLGFYTTNAGNGNGGPILFEMIINYTGGSITYNSTEEIGATTIDINNNFYAGYGLPFFTSYDEGADLFDSAISGNDLVFWSSETPDKFYFYIKLDTSIPDVTAFKYWNLDSNRGFGNLQIYGTNTDPATMGTGGADMHTTSNWTLLSSPSTTTNATGTSYSQP